MRKNTNISGHKTSTRLQALTAGMALGISLPLAADDIEIFTAFTPTNVNSNVVFIIDTSGSMDNAPSNSNSSTRKIDIVKQVFEQLIFDPQNPSDHSALNPNTSGISLAVMRFDQPPGRGSNNRGGYFLTKMEKLNNVNTAQTIWEKVNALSVNGFTPLAETMYEAALFFGGKPVHFGNSTQPGTNAPGVAPGGTYKSPILNLTEEEQCSINNHVVLLTDGMPTEDRDADTLINRDMEGNCGFDNNQDCLPDVARYLFQTDFNGTVAGTQNVKTHTIAFDLDQVAAVNLLKSTATNGGGLFKNASDGASLAAAIGQIIAEVNESASTFVTPAISLSDTNRFQHDNTLYFALYKPSVKPKWEGNVKGYQISPSGVLMDFSNPSIPAIDTQTNTFHANARSEWTTTGPADGPNVRLGGMVKQLPATRTIYTNIGGALTSIDSASPDHLGVPAAQKDALLLWAKGKMVDGNGNTVNRPNPVGDPLHSVPRMVTYPNGTSLLYVSTNEGFLHAIDTSNGQEKFAYIPNELLSNLKIFKENRANDSHPYGLDGPISIYQNNGNIYLIAAMRRGGKSYYALNITDPNDPQFLWQVSNGDVGFENLGQTWSRPIITKINTGSASSPVVKEVAMFGGGYDNQYDLANTIVSPEGASIYAVDVHTGQLVWKATGSGGSSVSASASQLQMPQFNNSMPADLAVIDLDLNGIADRFYAIDIAGRIFRVELNNIENDTFVPTGRLFADLSETGVNRLFYYGLDVALNSAGLSSYISLSAGSGFRAHPLESSISDKFFSVRDPFVAVSLPDNFTAITLADLTDTTSSFSNVNINNGWYLSLPIGEKVLAEASSVSGMLFFTTYTPPKPPAATDGPTCEPPLGTGKLYAVGLELSNPLADERFIDLNSGGIPPAPSFMIAQQPAGTNVTDSSSSTTSQLMVNVGTEGSKFTVSVQALKDTWEQP